MSRATRLDTASSENRMLTAGRHGRVHRQRRHPSYIWNVRAVRLAVRPRSRGAQLLELHVSALRLRRLPSRLPREISQANRLREVRTFAAVQAALYICERYFAASCLHACQTAARFCRNRKTGFQCPRGRGKLKGEPCPGRVRYHAELGCVGFDRPLCACLATRGSPGPSTAGGTHTR